MQPDLQVIAVGSIVRIFGDQEAKVGAIMIEGTSRVSYRVFWWNGKALQSEWLDSDFLSWPVNGPAPTMKVGFASYGKGT